MGLRERGKWEWRGPDKNATERVPTHRLVTQNADGVVGGRCSGGQVAVVRLLIAATGVRTDAEAAISLRGGAFGRKTTCKPMHSFLVACSFWSEV